jgi:hypothetical protein
MGFVDAIVKSAIMWRPAGRPPRSAASSPVPPPDLNLGSSADMTEVPIAEDLFSGPGRPA